MKPTKEWLELRKTLSYEDVYLLVSGQGYLVVSNGKNTVKRIGKKEVRHG